MRTDKNTKDTIAIETFKFLKENKDFVDMNSLGSYVSGKLNLSDSEKNDIYPSGDIKYLNMIRFGLLFLKKAGLVKNLERGKYILTEKGRAKDGFSAEEFARLRQDISRKSNKQMREAKSKSTQFDLFGKVKGNENLSKEELELLNRIVEQNNKIVEKLINK